MRKPTPVTASKQAAGSSDNSPSQQRYTRLANGASSAKLATTDAIPPNSPSNDKKRKAGLHATESLRANKKRKTDELGTNKRPSTKTQETQSKSKADTKTVKCEICQRVFPEDEYLEHLKVGKKHRKHLRSTSATPTPSTVTIVLSYDEGNDHEEEREPQHQTLPSKESLQPIQSSAVVVSDISTTNLDEIYAEDYISVSSSEEEGAATRVPDEEPLEKGRSRKLSASTNISNGHNTGTTPETNTERTQDNNTPSEATPTATGQTPSRPQADDYIPLNQPSSTPASSVKSPASRKGSAAPPSKLSHTAAPFTPRGNVVYMRASPLWLRSVLSDEPLRRTTFHEEILAFESYISPTAAERRMRADVLRRITQLIEEQWPEAVVRVFGSSATELYLPTSDIDLVVCDCLETGSYPLYHLAGVLERRRFAVPSDVMVIARARVPIVKAVDRATGCPLDISFHIGSGPENTAVVREYLKEFPPLRPMALMLKYFLLQRGLSEVYAGGLGSYALILLIVSFLQRMVRESGGKYTTGRELTFDRVDLGELLMGFLRFYGTEFNYITTGISLRDGGRYFPKLQRDGWYDSAQPWLLALEDPHNPENDVARSSFDIPSIRQAFATAYDTLTAAKQANREPELASIVRSDVALENYRQWIASMYGDDNEDNARAGGRNGSKRKHTKTPPRASRS